MTTLPVGQMTICQQNASAFASTPDASLDATRRAGISDALAALRDGRPKKALFLLAQSVERQNRIAGNGTIPLGICPVCGGRCTHGGAR